jgi:hypothetical protein
LNEKMMGPLLSLDRLDLVSVQSAMVTLRSDGQQAAVVRYSINRGPSQILAFPVVIDWDHPALVCITLAGQGRSFQPGENELRFWDQYGTEHLFLVTL